jgi:hypothetical protein
MNFAVDNHVRGDTQVAFRPPGLIQEAFTMKRFLPLAVAVLALGLTACEKTASQKIEDNAEDAGHSLQLGAERAGDKVNDATN